MARLGAAGDFDDGRKYDPSFTRPLSSIPPGAREALRPSTIIEGARGAQYEAARNALAPILVQPNQFARTFLRAVLDEATCRGVVANRAAKLGGAASTLAGVAAALAAVRSEHLATFPDAGPREEGPPGRPPVANLYMTVFLLQGG
jgi:hypothetical protein